MHYDYRVRTLSWGVFDNAEKAAAKLEEDLNADTSTYEGWELWQVTTNSDYHTFVLIYRRARTGGQ
jgi:hypothetical protein